MCQWNYPVKNDWTTQVRSDLEDLNFNVDLTDLKSKSKTTFKKIVKLKIKEFSLDYLNNLKEKHSKMENLTYSKLKLQNYLKQKEIPVQSAKNLFRWRTRVANFKNNYKSSYLSLACPLCFVHTDTQQHSLQCTSISNTITVRGDYEDIFMEEIPPDIADTLLKITTIRKDVL